MNFKGATKKQISSKDRTDFTIQSEITYLVNPLLQILQLLFTYRDSEVVFPALLFSLFLILSFEPLKDFHINLLHALFFWKGFLILG